MTYAIADHLRETSATLTRMASQTKPVEDISRKLSEALRTGHKLVVFGNGGSAADAQHFAAELVGRFENERPAIPAMALTTDTSILTAVANDYGYDHVFLRQVQAFVQPGDIVVGISTSGNARSVLLAIEEAKRRGGWTVGFSGQTGGKLKSLVDVCICVPSTRTAHIQECHIALIHAICAGVEESALSTLA